MKDCGIFWPGKLQKIEQATFELWQISEAGMMIIMALDTWYDDYYGIGYLVLYQLTETLTY